jgi:intracellular septation protein A
MTTPATEPDRSNQPSDQLPISNAIDSTIAVVLFIATNRLLGLPWAIGAATLWSLRALYKRWRSGSPIGKFLPIVTVVIVARGIIGIVTESEDVYFGLGIAGKVAIGLGLIGSVLIGRNLVEYAVPTIIAFDETTRAHPVYRRAMRVIGVVAGCYFLASATFDVWLYNNSSINGYVAIRFFVNWPVTTLIMVGCGAYLSRTLAQIPGFPGLGTLMERQMDNYSAALKARRPGSSR